MIRFGQSPPDRKAKRIVVTGFAVAATSIDNNISPPLAHLHEGHGGVSSIVGQFPPDTIKQDENPARLPPTKTTDKTNEKQPLSWRFLAFAGTSVTTIRYKCNW
ncbi:hypothetical protein [Acidisphaera sp. S103]|uniref:hypothetical protein n=1 Tax=Acidisphaera sp. S103 TaxID=1747223 RepID=UPI00131C900A|nr:hypothetical protein [Acidisphaera sp. S103]